MMIRVTIYSNSLSCPETRWFNSDMQLRRFLNRIHADVSYVVVERLAPA